MQKQIKKIGMMNCFNKYLCEVHNLKIYEYE